MAGPYRRCLANLIETERLLRSAPASAGAAAATVADLGGNRADNLAGRNRCDRSHVDEQWYVCPGIVYDVLYSLGNIGKVIRGIGPWYGNIFLLTFLHAVDIHLKRTQTIG